MSQQDQLIRLKRTGRDGESTWAYRYRVGGRESKRVQRGGFASEQDAEEALERELEPLRREQRVSRSLTITELLEAYLAQHDVDPVTIGGPSRREGPHRAATVPSGTLGRSGPRANRT